MVSISVRLARKANAAIAKRAAKGEPRIMSTHVPGAQAGAAYRKARAMRNQRDKATAAGCA